MADRLLRVGIAGYGRSGCDIHSSWMRLATDKYQVVGVADQLPKRRADAETHFGCKTYKDYRDLLKNAEIDLFINAMPSFLHSPGTVDGFRAGHHVVCEKPAGRTVKQFDAMTAAAKKARKTFFPFQNSRFFPFLHKMREIIDSGVLGEVVHIRTSWSGFGRRWDWQTLQEMDGGNLLNTGPHPMDHAIMLFGNKQPKVFCRMKAIHPFGGDAENFCVVTLYGGPRDPVIEVAISSFEGYSVEDRYVVSGTQGGMAGGPGSLRWKYFDPKKAPKQKMWKPWSLDRQYCHEALPWVEKEWKPKPRPLGDFQENSKAFYDNVYDVIVKKGKRVVKPSEVRRQIIAMQECHRQNPLPKRRVRK